MMFKMAYRPAENWQRTSRFSAARQLGERHPAKNMSPEFINWHGASRADSREGADFMAEQTYIQILDPVNYSRMHILTVPQCDHALCNILSNEAISPSSSLESQLCRLMQDAMQAGGVTIGTIHAREDGCYRNAAIYIIHYMSNAVWPHSCKSYNILLVYTYIVWLYNAVFVTMEIVMHSFCVSCIY